MQTKKTSLTVFLISGSGASLLVIILLFVVASLVLFLLSDLLKGVTWLWDDAALHARETAKLLLTVGALNFLLRTKIWKDAIDSISERLKLKDATLLSGLTECWKFDEVPWKQLFDDADTVTIVAISARPLLVQQLALLRDFLSREGTCLQLVLSDFREQALMSRFDAEFNEAPGTRAKKLKEALTELFKALKDHDGANVEIFLSTSRVPYSAYRFDGRVLFVPYVAEPVRDSRRVPALLFGDGRMRNEYLEPDFKYLLGKSKIDHADLSALLAEA
jgi:hypothetical protein